MKETKALYYEDPYVPAFSARILDITQKEGTLYLVTLDETAFFPEGGGQSGDVGKLAGGVVIDTHIKKGIIIHTVDFKDATIPKKWETVSGEVNFPKRLTRMQHHTAEHIFSGFCKKYFGYENVGFHLGENKVTMDYNGPLSQEDINKLEMLTNNAIMRNLPVRCYFPTEEELEKLDFRSKLELSEMGKVRIVEVDGVDICACCAPHVKSTGEIGIMKVVEKESHKGGTRLTIICGSKAIRDYEEKHRIISSLSQKFSVPMDGVEDALKKQDADIENLKLHIRDLERTILNTEIKNARANNDYLGWLVMFTDISDKILLRNTANSLMENNTLPIFFFNGNDERGYNFTIAVNPHNQKDDSETLLSRLRSELDIKGGGKNPMIQGICADSRDKIQKTLKAFRLRDSSQGV